ncbi:extracellular solute-binding protein [Gracilibacillus sp. HCP3S3_G5_1]|uniref:extracellular solute-binding protein n=1 Tax=unclassified Gracilibacillus TaxID=2625209 RepID=UPI003F89E927
MRKSLLFILFILLALATACSDDESSSSEDSEDVQGSSDTIEITIGKAGELDSNLPNGDTVEDNEYTRFLEEELNVDYVLAYQGSSQDIEQKNSLAIASGDIPDVMVVDKTQLTQLVEADLIEDMTEAFNNTVSDDLRGAYEDTGDYGLEQATYDGKLMAIPNINPGADGINLLWIREDWLDQLNLDVPETLDDLIEVAKAFKEQDPNQSGKDDTVGLLGSQSIVNIGNSLFGFDTIFSYFDAYPEMWIENDNGEVVYGSIQPETKEALGKLREMYELGVIEQEFGVKKPEDSEELVVNGTSGMLLYPWWAPFSVLRNQLEQDPKAEWIALTVPKNAEGTMNTHMTAPSSSYLVVRKGFERPEVIVETLNYQFDIDQVQGDGYGFYEGEEDMGFNWAHMPFSLLLSRYDDKEVKAAQVKEVIEGNGSPDDLMGEPKQVYEDYLVNQENPKKDLSAWARANAFLQGADIINTTDVNKVQGVFYGQTETMEKRWANLQTMEDEAFLQIILGSEPLDYFDEFVSKWKSQGGDTITEEVSEIVNEN